MDSLTKSSSWDGMGQHEHEQRSVYLEYDNKLEELAGIVAENIKFP